MKKVTLFLGAIVLGFILTSCESKKDQTINMINAFFDQEIAELNQTTDLKSFYEFDSISNDAFTDFEDKLDNMCDPKMDFIGMNAEEDSIVWDVFNKRVDDWYNLYSQKQKEYYEPLFSELESAYNELDNLVEEYGGDVETVPDELYDPLYDNFMEKLNQNKKYWSVFDENQFARLIEMFGNEEDLEFYMN